MNRKVTTLGDGSATAQLTAVVIGAGSAGLASAAELQKAGLHVTVLEGGDCSGSAWADRYRSLRLNTLRTLSGLPGLPIDPKHGDWVTGAGFAEYLQDYARHYRLDVRTKTRALTLERRGDGRWAVDIRGEQLVADVVVVATGNAATPITPLWAESFTGLRLHTSGYHTPEDLPDDSVLIVGSGNSATEIATELASHVERVWMSVRSAPLLVKSMQMGISTHRISVMGAGLPDWVWDASSLFSHWSLYHDLAKLGLRQPDLGSSAKFNLTGIAPVAERGFAKAVRAGRIVIVPEALSAKGCEVQLAGGQILRPAALLLATGFRPSYPALLSSLPVLKDDGRPLAWGEALPGCEGLFVVGSSSLQGDLREHGREAVRVAQIARAMAVQRSDARPRFAVGA